MDKVGYVIVTYGICDAFASMALSLLISKLGRIPIFVMASIINYVLIATLFLWTPNSNETHVFFIIAAFWGVSDAIWQTQINGVYILFYFFKFKFSTDFFLLALYGVLFIGADSTGGFSNYRLWESVGFIVAYILQTQVCIEAKLWILVAMLGLGMTGYLLVEWRRATKA